ncbi:RNA dependent RNA polymerase domain-containing protein [Trichoderma evansii]
MELFLTNVPGHLSDDRLRVELEPYTKALGIKDWLCDKPNKKTHAWIVLLSEADGKRFLKRHESVLNAPTQPKISQNNKSLSQSKTRAEARLYILKTPIYVKKSNRKVDKFTLQHLEYMKEHREKKAENENRSQKNSSDSNNSTISTPIRGISCGKNIFAGESDALMFVQQSSFLVKGVAKFGRRALMLTLDQEFRIDISYEIIQDLVAGASNNSLTLVLIETPRFYKKQAAPAQSGHAPHFTKWERQTHISIWPAHDKYVAHCLVYQITLASHYMETLETLRSRNVIAITRQNLPVLKTPRPFEEDYTTSMSRFEEHIGSAGISGRTNLLPFVILFQLQALVWNNYLHPAIATKLLHLMTSVARDCKRSGTPLPFTTDAMKQLFQKIPYPCPGVEPRDLFEGQLASTVLEVERSLRNENQARTLHYGAQLPRHQAWILKAMVTPTRITLHGPDAENMNRVLRMFPNHSDYFMRVIFGDEDGQDLALTSNVKNTMVFERYRKVLKDGIQVAGRKFEFLGFSHSSLRSHSAWFVAAFLDDSMKLQSNDTIIKSLGDFSDIRIAAKCAARIGQAFSETPYAVPILKCGINIEYIDDVKSADGKRVFSDGVGTISWDAMEEVWDQLPKASEATCFQVRLGGIKGMLSLDSRLNGKVICVRKESMMKFPSNDQTEMGICDTASKPMRAFLNRQTIKILEDMGTNSEWFIDQQNKALNLLRNVTTTAANTSIFLKSQLVGTTAGLPRLIRYLSTIGIDYRRERFMKSVVDHTILRELRLLKHKARIPVDMGVTLFGVMDETGFLEEGQIYVTFDESHDTIQGRVKRSLKDGTVLVTRSPALHPGDIQLAQMTTPPQGHPLLNLKNCVVFSQKGSRDLPSQLSGGDLDGDLYNIFWDPFVIPKQYFSPANYPRVSPPELDRAVTRDDIADFFVNFMEADILGIIANRHQMLADHSDEGTLSGHCVELAEMHSTAVDYSKTGIPVKIQDMPKPPRMRPDFLAPAPPTRLYDRGEIDHIDDPNEDEDDEDGMGMAKYKYYTSVKILGELFRGVDEKKIWAKDVQRPVDMSGASLWDQLDMHVRAALREEGYSTLDIDYKRRIDYAWTIRDVYESAVSNNMWQFSSNPRVPVTEVEAFCGSILNPKGSQTRRQRDSSIKLKDEMDGVMSHVVKLIGDRSGGVTNFDDVLSTMNDDDEIGERKAMNAIELSWACMVVGNDKSWDKSYRRDEPKLESFRVVAACCLVKELNDLLTRKNWGRVLRRSGGFVGVSQGYPNRQHGSLPMR